MILPSEGNTNRLKRFRNESCINKLLNGEKDLRSNSRLRGGLGFEGKVLFKLMYLKQHQSSLHWKSKLVLLMKFGFQWKLGLKTDQFLTFWSILNSFGQHKKCEPLNPYVLVNLFRASMIVIVIFSFIDQIT